MKLNCSLLRRTALLLVVALVFLTPAASADSPDTNTCLYPSMHDRFGFSADHSHGLGLYAWNLSRLNAAFYLDWGANPNAIHPNGMDYFPMVHIDSQDASLAPYGYRPNGAELVQAIEGNLGATWLLGNEADYRRDHDYALPEEYARAYHDIYTIIKANDPTAKVAFNGIATVSPLRLAWMDRVWSAYQTLYGQQMPVDVWNVHTYVVNEMVHEWGPDLPTGFENAVGYAVGVWTKTPLAGASGGTVHASNTRNARAYFAFAGRQATLTLHTGPDAGIADIYLDKVLVQSVDLYAATPGIITRTFSNLPVSNDPHLSNRHHLRVNVGWWKNNASSNYFVRVDSLAAESTAGLPGGRLEDDSPLVATIIVSVDEYDDLDNLRDQLLLMRQWMANHGQRNKPLINTEFGILIGEEQGFTYSRVREYMLGAFDLLASSPDAFNAALGMPDDGNRMMQQWFWFILNFDYFNGSRIYTGLADPVTGAVRPLGNDFATYVTRLRAEYRDLKTTYLAASPAYALFTGQPSLVTIQGQVRNLGTLSTSPFQIKLSAGTTDLNTWQAPGLSAQHGNNDSFELNYQWSVMFAGNKSLTLTADSSNHVIEPCDSNNVMVALLAPPQSPDLVLRNLRATPSTPTSSTTMIRLSADVANLGGQGSPDQAITVRFWQGAAGSGSLLHTVQIPRGQAQTVAEASYEWRNFLPGEHLITVEVLPASGESTVANNQKTVTVIVPTGDNFVHLPVIGVGSVGGPVQSPNPASSHNNTAYWLPDSGVAPGIENPADLWTE